MGIVPPLIFGLTGSVPNVSSETFLFMGSNS